MSSSLPASLPVKKSSRLWGVSPIVRAHWDGETSLLVEEFLTPVQIKVRAYLARGWRGFDERVTP